MSLTPRWTLSEFPSKALRFARRQVTYWGFRLFERLLPVRKNFWCFCTWNGRYGHTLDNPRAVFEEIKNDPSIVKVILSRSETNEMPHIEGVNVIVAHVNSLRGAYYLAISNVVLVGYALLAMTEYARHLTVKHKIIQLWHGIPLKRIGHLFPPERALFVETTKYAATVCSSESDQAFMAAAFAPIPAERVWMTGLPRNDLFARPEQDLPRDYRDRLDELRVRLRGRRLVLYAPTWRTTGAGAYTFSATELERLGGVLTRYNAVLAMRGHSNGRPGTADPAESPGMPIIMVNDFPDIAVLLRLTDVLVTDYSSVYIDFLLAERPILHFTYDLKTYVNERGFLYSLDEAFAGPPLETFDALESELGLALEHGVRHPQDHARARTLFHAHGDRPSLDVVNRIRTLAAPNE